MDNLEPLKGSDIIRARDLVLDHHYLHSIPAGKTYWWAVGDAVVCYTIPANRHLGKFLLGWAGVVWELARLWAPDGHEANLLTQAISVATTGLTRLEPVEAVVSFADPNVGHRGGVYRAASWVYTGQSEEGRYYTDLEGNIYSRRSFHSGRVMKKKAEILSMGYKEVKKPGKLRFARGITRHARKAITERFNGRG